jgi:RNA polymerase sigma-70 factor (ECF subfamily)
MQLEAALALVATGDRHAFAQLYKATAPHLYGLALRILKRRDWAEDVVQETYLQIWHKAALYHADAGSPRAWLSVMLRNRSFDRLRRERARGSGTTAPFDEVLQSRLADEETPSPFDGVADGAEARRLADCLEGLEANPRRAIQLAFWDGLTHDELSMRLAAPLGTVKSWIRRGLMRLKACLDL